MNASLDLYSLTLVSGDSVISNQPALQYVNWKRSIRTIAVENPTTRSIVVAPGETQSFFNGMVPLTTDGTTEFSLELSPLASDIYRITWTAGTDPTFRVDRGVDVTGNSLTLTVNLNGTMTVDTFSGTPFASVLVGDEVFIPGPTTGDPDSPFNSINEGAWSVIAVGGLGASLTLVRPAGQDFSGVSEVLIPTAQYDLLAFSSTGVRIGNGLDISAGFALVSQKTFEVTQVTSKWVEIRSSQALPDEFGIIPGAMGIQVFKDAKRYFRIEVDQECIIRLNGDSDSSVRVSPWVAGDPGMVGEFTKTGPTWEITVLNRSSQAMNATFISVE